MENTSRIKFIEHKGKKILYNDCSHLRGYHFELETKKSRDIIVKEPEGSVLNLVILNDAMYDSEINKLLRDVIEEIQPYLKAVAIIGVERGSMQVTANAINRAQDEKMKYFNDVEEAKDWLVSL